ncbi:MAG: class I SAM-dependent methyltransferase, partial [Melioribacteraceae bacterium]
YKDWAEYIFSINNNNKIKKEYVLELAGGNGKLTSFLKEYFPKIIFTDLSKEMIINSECQPELRLSCDMRAFPFKIKFPLIISAFDSINYLMSKEQLNKLFENIYNSLSDDGIFTFDASLEKNSIKNERRLNRKGKFNKIKYVQKSIYDNSSKIHYNYFEIILDNGEIIREVHKQKIYEFTEYFSVIEKNGLYVKNCYDSFSFDDADENCDRVQFVVKKRI